MATADGEKKLPLLKILNVSLDYCLENFKAVAGFSAVNLLFLLVTLLLPGGYGNPLFLIWLVFYYVFWCFFFRFYFNRRPYLMFRKIFDSLVPSTKILFLTAVFGFGLSLLPYFRLQLPVILPAIRQSVFCRPRRAQPEALAFHCLGGEEKRLPLPPLLF